MRLSLDANVLVYAADNQAGVRHRLGTQLLRRASRVDSFLTVQTLGEFFHVITRKGKVTTTEAAAVVGRLRSVFPVEAADPGTLDIALPAVLRHGLLFWDAMLWATVQQAGCQILLTEDFQDGRKLGSVTFVNPFDGRNEGLLERALPSA
jgi:predicted nucleic acid-binding protein